METNETIQHKKKLDAQTEQLNTMLWTYCVPYYPEFQELPKMISNETEKNIGDYLLEDLCGVGNFASVRNCRKSNETQAFVIKLIEKKTVSSISGVQRILHEIKALRILQSEYVTNLVEVVHTKSHVGFVLEKGPDDLYKYLDDFPTGVHDDVAVKKIAGNVLDALQYCHKKGVCHRDIKPENILLDANTYEIKLCDFGLCAFLTKSPLRDFVGSPGFFAPEMLLAKEYDGAKADIWSFAAVLLEMVLGHDTFYKLWLKSYSQEHVQSQNREWFRKEMECAVSRVFKHRYFTDSCGVDTSKYTFVNILRQMLSIDPLNRPEICEIYENMWMSNTPTTSSSFSSNTTFEFAFPPIQPKPTIETNNNSKIRFIKF